MFLKVWSGLDLFKMSIYAPPLSTGFKAEVSCRMGQVREACNRKSRKRELAARARDATFRTNVGAVGPVGEYAGICRPAHRYGDGREYSAPELSLVQGSQKRTHATAFYDTTMRGYNDMRKKAPKGLSDTLLNNRFYTWQMDVRTNMHTRACLAQLPLWWVDASETNSVIA